MINNIPILRSSHIWAPSLIRQKLKSLFKLRHKRGPVHILFCLADHFEPQWKNADIRTEKERLRRWIQEYPELASTHRDSNGRPLQHTWFYAAEQYNPQCLEELSKLCMQGFGEIELHLHHGNDTPEGFRQKLEQAKTQFSRHGAFITQGNSSSYAFGFIHGNWALNNSRNDPRMCGVNNELRILRECGCYADFTLPSAPHESQTRKINSIYYAQDILGKTKSHDQGIDVKVGGEEVGDLMLIQGPLALNWKNRKLGVLPRIENGCIQRSSPGTKERIDLWVQQHIHVRGRPEWIFIKVYCHGAQEEDMDALLGENAHRMYSHLEKKYNDGKRFVLHYVTAREMYNVIKAAEDGKTGNPVFYKDLMIRPYLNSGKKDVSV
jgi:hypothetical protein